MTAVVDVSVLIAALVNTKSESAWAERLIEQNTLAAPQLVLVETTNVLRRLENAAQLSALESSYAFRDLLRLDIELFPYPPFAERVWELRHNATSYDAWYIALAEALEIPLATLDYRLAKAPGASCQFLVPEQDVC